MSRSTARTRTQVQNTPRAKSLIKAEPFSAKRRLIIGLSILLLISTIALYSPVLGYSFLGWDDHDYVTANPHVHQGLTWRTVKWAFASTETASYWHPLTWLSHALDYQLFALNPAGHHFDSVLIHAINAALLFLLLAWITKRVKPSLLVAALFAVPPLNVESVAWVAERKNVLSTLFFILAIGAYVRYTQKPGWRRYLLLAVLFAAGLMAKPMVITLPFVLLLLDYWPLERMPLDGPPVDGGENGPDGSNGPPRVTFSRLLLEKAPLLVLSAASAAITLVVQRIAEGTVEAFPPGIRVENAIVSYGLYLWKMIWPARLAAFYPHPASLLPVWQVTVSALILAGGTALVIVFRRKRYLPVGWFWFLGTLVPVIGLVQAGGQAMADRFAYVPLIGIFVMIAWGLDDLAEPKEVGAVWRIVPAACVLTTLAFVTSRQLSSWKNEYTMWMHALAVTDTNAYAHAALGAALMDPDLLKTANGLPGLNTDQERMDEARHQYDEALKAEWQLAGQNPGLYEPYLAMTLYQMGNLDRTQNRPTDARQHYELALKYYRHLAQQSPDPNLLNLAGALSNLAAADRRLNRLDDARQHLEESLIIHERLSKQDPANNLPDIAFILNNLENLDGLQNRVDDARRHFEESLKTYRQLSQQNPMFLPGLAMTLNNIGLLDGNQGRIEDERAHYTEALSVYQKLAQADSARFAGEVARVQTSLEQLEKKAPSQ